MSLHLAEGCTAPCHADTLVAQISAELLQQLVSAVRVTEASLHNWTGVHWCFKLACCCLQAESDGKPDSAASDNGVVAADASANSENQATVQVETNEKGALDRQINPKGSPTPMELPPEAQKAADESGVDEAAMEGDDSAGGTADQSNAVEVTVPKDDKSAPSPTAPEVAEGAGSKEGADAGTVTVSASAAGLGEGVQDEALKRQTNPKGSPTPMELPPEAEKAAQVSRVVK